MKVILIVMSILFSTSAFAGYKYKKFFMAAPTEAKVIAKIKSAIDNPPNVTRCDDEEVVANGWGYMPKKKVKKVDDNDQVVEFYQGGYWSGWVRVRCNEN